MTSAVPSTDPAAPRLIPETYPPQPAAPCVRARRIHWLLGVPAAVLATLAPRRMGPHLAASGWIAAYLTHIACIVLLIGTVAAIGVLYASFYGFGMAPADLTTSEALRAPLAALVILAMTLAEEPDAALAILLGAAVGEGLVWLVGLLLIPLFAAGETRRKLYLRCVKLTLWAISCAAAIALPLAWFTARFMMKEREQETIALLGIAWICAGLWWLTIVLRLGARYGGPPSGPGFASRTLRCESCGYDLTMSPEDGRCPECGQPVAHSLPAHRALPSFAQARGVLAPLWAYCTTAWARCVRRSVRPALLRVARSPRRTRFRLCHVRADRRAGSGVRAAPRAARLRVLRSDEHA